MSPGAIKARGEQQAVLFDTARQIRDLLDGAREKYGAEVWDADDKESEVLELVTGEDEP